jgi:hypothetical protein
VGKDWVDWHRGYDNPDSPLGWRLATVQRRIAEAFDAAPAGPVTVASLCAGDGRDLLGVLAVHPRADDVTALLVEQNETLAGRARARARTLPGAIDVVTGDAAMTDRYRRHAPSDLLLFCGIFGNIADGDIARTIAASRGLCRRGAVVIWTRHRRVPDLTPSIRSWFAAAHFVERAFDTSDDATVAVGTYRYDGVPAPLAPGRRLFEFR